ncbi:hypothetical protein PR048_008133 [Dryococelus australis]|uniref:NYN domain-containing protein n=1 Tax=Dryococelus australis TaxID=614101 RepID=A0ABQ9HW80_9NEOP|nr:hypothetical protein PR048_008133 [Dryococelus australis]
MSSILVLDSCSFCIWLKEEIRHNCDQTSKQDLIKYRVHKLKVKAFYEMLQKDDDICYQNYQISLCITADNSTATILQYARVLHPPNKIVIVLSFTHGLSQKDVKSQMKLYLQFTKEHKPRWFAHRKAVL